MQEGDRKDFGSCSAWEANDLPRGTICLGRHGVRGNYAFDQVLTKWLGLTGDIPE